MFPQICAAKATAHAVTPELQYTIIGDCGQMCKNNQYRNTTEQFLVADTQLYKRLCPSVRRSVGNDRVEKWKNKRFGYFFV